jgi:hypothetical protein
MAAGVLQQGDAQVTARLLLGMVIWIARWYRPAEGFSPDDIAENAINLLFSSAAEVGREQATAARRRSPLRRRS